jgi:peptidoglycan hydrolase-like protein with peptidoglycan-binding domain
LPGFSRKQSAATSSGTGASNTDTSTLQWANSFQESSSITDHIIGGGQIEIGDRGPEVKELQAMLGISPVDGIFGPMTFHQVLPFQAAYGLPQSGVVDLPTYARLSQIQQSGTDPQAVLFSLAGAGSSAQTATQDGLSSGPVGSQRMAKNDEDKVLNHKDKFEAVAMQFDIPAAILAAIASRETRGGGLLNDEGYSIYQGNAGFGMMQVDAGYHSPQGGPESLEHIEQAAGILVGFRDQLRNRHPDWSEPQLLKGAVAAYNCGPGRVTSATDMDASTTGGDYSNDTWVRAQYYARFFGSTGPTA